MKAIGRVRCEGCRETSLFISSSLPYSASNQETKTEFRGIIATIIAVSKRPLEFFGGEVSKGDLYNVLRPQSTAGSLDRIEIAALHKGNNPVF